MGLGGVYINLDRSADRRAQVQAQLDALGLGQVRRLPAVDGRALQLPDACRLAPAEYGCLLSHLQAVESGPPGDWVLVLEDDAELSPDLPAFLASGALDGLAGHDLVLLDCQPECSSHHMAQLWGCLQRRLGPGRRATGVDVVRAADIYRWGLAAYLVSPRGRQRLAQVFRDGLTQGPVTPNDLLAGQAMRDGRLDAVVLVPFLATARLQSHAESTIGPAGARDIQALASVLRRLLFAGPVGDLEDWATPLLAMPRAHSPELALAGRVLAELFAIEAREGVLAVGRVAD